MRVLRTWVTAGLFCVLGLASPSPANAQGCTLGLPSSIETAIDSLLLGACDRPDDCWLCASNCSGIDRCSLLHRRHWTRHIELLAPPLTLGAVLRQRRTHESGGQEIQIQVSFEQRK